MTRDYSTVLINALRIRYVGVIIMHERCNDINYIKTFLRAIVNISLMCSEKCSGILLIDKSNGHYNPGICTQGVESNPIKGLQHDPHTVKSMRSHITSDDNVSKFLKSLKSEKKKRIFKKS